MSQPQPVITEEPQPQPPPGYQPPLPGQYAQEYPTSVQTMMQPGQMMAQGQPMMASGQPMMAQGQPMMQPHQMQPQTTAATTNVVLINQQPAGPPPQRGWSTGLCGCFEDCGSCCFALCCYQMLLADVSGRLGEGRCYGYCCPCALLGLRIKARTKYNIKGSLCKDTCAVYLCKELVLCQLAREMDYVQGTR